MKPWETKEAGSYNVAPTNFRLATESDWARRMFHYPIERQEFRQIHRQADGVSIHDLEGYGEPKGYLETRLFWFFDGTGCAISSHYDFRKNTYSMKHWLFAICEHKYKEISHQEAQDAGLSTWGMHCHAHKCEKCGDVKLVDSSG